MKHILSAVLSRLLWVIGVILGVSIITFVLMHNIPGNPWNASTDQRQMFNIALDPISMRQLDRQFGLDQPLWKQYTSYMFGSISEDGEFFCGAICGNLGPSLRLHGGKVTTNLFGVPEGLGAWHSRFGYTIRLAFYGFVFSALVGIPLGFVLAIKKGSRFEHATHTFLTILLAIPNFILGILLILIVALGLKLVSVLPDWNDPVAWIMPVVVLAVIPTVNLARITQVAVRNVMQGDYVRTAVAKGLSRYRVMAVHIFPNALVPIVTALGPILIELIAGSYIIEALFGFPGMGREYWLAIKEMDYPVIMGLTLLYSLGIVSVNVLVEILYGIMDPRLRKKEA